MLFDVRTRRLPFYFNVNLANSSKKYGGFEVAKRHLLLVRFEAPHFMNVEGVRHLQRDIYLGAVGELSAVFCVRR